MKDREWFNLDREKGLQLLNSVTQECLAHFSSVINFAKMAINGAIILNGSSAIAILYNFEKLPSSINMLSLLFCSIGAMLAVICSGLSYVVQRKYADFAFENSKKYIECYYKYMYSVYNNIHVNMEQLTPQTSELGKCTNILNYAITISWIVSILCFVCVNILVFFNIDSILDKIQPIYIASII